MSKKSELDQLTPELYSSQLLNRVKNGEESADALNLVHVIEKYPNYDQETGDKVSTPVVKRYTLSAWGLTPDRGVQDYLRCTKAKYTVLYDPRAPKAELNADDVIEAEGGAEEPSRRGRKPKAE